MMERKERRETRKSMRNQPQTLIQKAKSDISIGRLESMPQVSNDNSEESGSESKTKTKKQLKEEEIQEESE